MYHTLMPVEANPAAPYVRVFKDLFACEMPAIPASDPVEFWACSLDQGSARFIDNAPFKHDDDRFYAGPHKIRAYSDQWLYYPVPFSAALAAHGIHNTIHCHSGRTVVDGEYVN